MDARGPPGGRRSWFLDRDDRTDERIASRYVQKVDDFQKVDGMHSKKRPRKRKPDPTIGIESSDVSRHGKAREIELQEMHDAVERGIGNDLSPVDRALIYGSVDGGPPEGQGRLPADVAEFALTGRSGGYPCAMMEPKEAYVATRDPHVKQLISAVGRDNGYSYLSRPSLTFVDVKRHVERAHNFVFENLTLCPCVYRGQPMAVAVLDFVGSQQPVFLASLVYTVARDSRDDRSHVAQFVGRPADDWFKPADDAHKADAGRTFVDRRHAVTATHRDLSATQMSNKHGIMEQCPMTFEALIVNKPAVYDTNDVEIY